MNGFQNKKSACLIRLRHPVFFSPVLQTCSLKTFLNLIKNMEDGYESLTNHVRRLRYPSSNYFVHWTKPHFSETILLIISGFSILSCYTILRSVTSLLLLHFFTYVCSFLLLLFFYYPVSSFVLIILSRHITKPNLFFLILLR